MQTLKLSVLFLFLEKELLKLFEKYLLRWKTFLPNRSKVDFIWDQVLSNSGFTPVRRLSELKEGKRNTVKQGLA